MMVLTPAYEPVFRDCSYAYRPGRSQHQALRALWKALMDLRGGVVIDMDISGFFDNLDHGHLRTFLDSRVRDGVIRRSIDKWLKAGVLENGMTYHPVKGTPQGGVVSSLLANVYLHNVIDVWFEDVVCPKLRGRAKLVRFADDVIIVIERPDDARRVMDVLGKRLGKYGLALSAEKTQMVSFRRPDLRDDDDEPGSFVFLGFTHYWGRSRKKRWVVKQKTAKGAMKRAMASLRQWLLKERHAPIKEQHATLCCKLRGHDNYYGITGNGGALSRIRHHVRRAWRAALNRRSENRHMPWSRFVKLLKVYPLPPRCVKPLAC